MNNRLKVALLVVSLVAITPQIQAAWYHPSAWVAGIQSAATNVSKWWYAKNYTPAEIAALKAQEKTKNELVQVQEEAQARRQEELNAQKGKAEFLLYQQSKQAAEKQAQLSKQ